MADQLKIDTAEEFPHLANAPIVEAALEIRARAEAPWEEAAILEQLKSRLPDYPTTLALHAFQQQFQFGPNQAAQGTSQDLGLKGFRLQSRDNLQITLFNRDGFTLSRLPPYESWEQFSAEGFRLWDIYMELARPSQIQRLGLRFINRINLRPQEGSLDRYLVAPPQTPADLDFPFVAFLHHDSFAVPGESYFINVVKTVQPAQNGVTTGPALIFDIDVFSEQPFALEDKVLRDKVAEMRWLKNKFFFGSITSGAWEAFK
jgi:uncharacterized protein (TIGR04255 family)